MLFSSKFLATAALIVAADDLLKRRARDNVHASHSASNGTPR